MTSQVNKTLYFQTYTQRYCRTFCQKCEVLKAKNKSALDIICSGSLNTSLIKDIVNEALNNQALIYYLGSHWFQQHTTKEQSMSSPGDRTQRLEKVRKIQFLSNFHLKCLTRFTFCAGVVGCCCGGG